MYVGTHAWADVCMWEHKYACCTHVCIYMYQQMYICMQNYPYIPHQCINLGIYVHKYTYYTHTYVVMDECIYVHMYVCACLYKYVFIHICMHIGIHGHVCMEVYKHSSEISMYEQNYMYVCMQRCNMYVCTYKHVCPYT